MATYGSTSGGGITEATTTQQTSGDSPYVMVDTNLRGLLRDEDITYINPVVKEIHRITERKIENLIAKKNQFRFSNGKLLGEGMSYHIHYTKSLDEFFMSEAKHSSTSELLYPINIDVSSFSYYNFLNKQIPIKLNSNVTIPTEKDYEKGSYKRYFVKQSNDKNQSPFEISKQDYQSSPLYNHIELRWYISGPRNYVYAQNIKSINIASISISDVRRILTPFQFYRFEENLSDAERIRRKLQGSCSLGPQYKSKAACEAAGGVWSYGMMSLSNYGTTTLSGATTGAGNAWANGGSCSLGPQYTTKASCEAAGGVWTDGTTGLSTDGNGNYVGNSENDGKIDAAGDFLDPNRLC
jgi:hypothetical protein